MKLLWQDLPVEGIMEVGSRVRIKEEYNVCKYANSEVVVSSGTKGTIVGFLTLEFAYVQYDNIKKPSDIFTRQVRYGETDGWVTPVNRLDLI